MFNKSFSLIIKIAIMVFISFMIILGNEMRIGVDNYVANTLKSDAASIASSMEKLEQTYIDVNSNLSNNGDDSSALSSDKFKETFNTFLDDSYKITCITDNDGKILDITRPYYSNPNIQIIGSANEIISIEIKNLDNKSLKNIESYLLNHTDDDIDIKIVFTGSTELQESMGAYDSIKIKELYLQGESIYTNDNVKGETTSIEGYLGYFEDLDYQLLYEVENSLIGTVYDGLDGELVTQYVVINDFASMRSALEYQLKNNFSEFVDNYTFVSSTSNAEYYLLDQLEDSSRNSITYSTTMCKFYNWIDADNVENMTYDELQQSVVEGYCFVIQKYNHLYAENMSSFIAENTSTYSIAILLMIIICFGLSFFIIRPIRRIERVTQAITHKDFRHHLKSNRNDEIGSLARNINAMSDELEKTINSLYLEIDRVKYLENIRKEFIANFTHEIKTPLGIIQGFSELIEIEDDESKRDEYIGIIQQETKKINELVVAMLDLSKLESKNITLNLTSVNITELVDETLETMSSMIHQKNITIVRDFKDITIEADYDRMESVIINLLSNAINHTFVNGHIYITINEIGFYIENEGHQIKEEELEKIWLAFHKTNKSRNDKGTGLGLAIVKAALDLHEMKYEAKNTSKGVMFYFEFNKVQSE